MVKVDFEKAYDLVNRKFLYYMMVDLDSVLYGLNGSKLVWSRL